MSATYERCGSPRIEKQIKDPIVCFNISSRKIIGARYYVSGYVAEIDDGKTMFKSSRDNNGHGCQTTSIAAGRYVADMNYKGLASRRDNGASPVTRIAVYKICCSSCCYDVDLLAAFDDAIRDGIHVISLSL